MLTIQSRSIGTYQDQQINEYTLHNSKGMEVKVINYGATITSICLPDGQGESTNVVCGFDTLDGYFGDAYLKNAPYFGCTVGRYASRIKDGRFSIEGQEYTLAVNDGSNHLHGGLVGFDKRVWEARIVEVDGLSSLQMSLESTHLDEGYPGNVAITVTFSLNDKNELSISYVGNTDQSTPLSLTNHSYFSLSGFQDTIEQHHAQISSDRILAPDETNVPVGKIEKVTGTAADLRDGRLLGACFKELKTGFEHYYLFDHPSDQLTKIAEFMEPQSGRALEILTTEPGALFYTGYFTSDELARENGDLYGRYRGFCVETSRYPNGPNLQDSPKSITHPDEAYKSQTVFRFSSS